MTSLSGLALIQHGAAGLTTGTEHPQLIGIVTAYVNLFDVLQVTPLLGRTFLPEDGVEGRDRVAILTYPLWQSVFQGDPNVIGRTIRVADTPREVIGVLPAGFHFPNKNALRAYHSKQPASTVPEPAVFTPAVLQLSQYSWNGEYGNWVAIGRLKNGVGIRQANAQLTAVEAQIVREMPGPNRNDQPDALLASLQPMQEAVVGESRTGLWLLMAAVIGLMLIACVNLANAQVGRALSRRRDAALRTALGAARWRLVWSSLAENFVLAGVGGTAGVLLAIAGLGLFRGNSPVDLPRLSEVHVNLTVLLFSLALTLGASILSGILPALKLLNADPHAALRQGNRNMGNRQSSRLRGLLIALQVFGCTVLLLVTGLFAKSLLYLTRQDIGFETGHAAIAEVTLAGKSYDPAPARIAFIDGALEKLRAVPGVQAAGLGSAMPLEGESWLEGLGRVDRPGQEESLINLRWASPGYFEGMRQRLVAGRFFEERDRNGRSIVLSEGAAKALWPNGNPIDGQVRTQGRQLTVIGVVADSRNTSLKAAPVKMAYLHYSNRPPYRLYFVARGAQSGQALVSGMRQAIWQYAPGCDDRAHQAARCAAQRFAGHRAFPNAGPDDLRHGGPAARHARHLWRAELLHRHTEAGNRRTHGARRQPAARSTRSPSVRRASRSSQAWRPVCSPASCWAVWSRSCSTAYAPWIRRDSDRRRTLPVRRGHRCLPPGAPCRLGGSDGRPPLRISAEAIRILGSDMHRSQQSRDRKGAR